MLSAVKEKDLKVLLKLVNLALQRIPKMVRDDQGATVLTIFSQILPLLAEERLGCASITCCCFLY